MALQTRNKYTKKSQLGSKGKEARTFLVEDKFGCEYAMKVFRKNKSTEKLTEEVMLQRRCSDKGISPKIVDYDTEKKFIVMEKMDCHLIEVLRESKGILTENFQNQIIRLFKVLDSLKVFHGDANPLNYMLKDGKVFIIDFGYSKHIDEKFCKKLGSNHPNSELMLLGFVLKLKDMNCPQVSFKILKSHLSEATRKQYGI